MELTHANPNWWWTIARGSSKCRGCGETVPDGATMAYDSHGQDVLCEMCAEDQGVASECKESKRFQKARGRTPPKKRRLTRAERQRAAARLNAEAGASQHRRQPSFKRDRPGGRSGAS